MSPNDILDDLLLTLADEFEAGNRKGRTLTPSSAEEYEPLRECIATLIAEGSVEEREKMRIYFLTKAGYLKYKPRIDALRALSRRPCA